MPGAASRGNGPPPARLGPSGLMDGASAGKLMFFLDKKCNGEARDDREFVLCVRKAGGERSLEVGVPHYIYIYAAGVVWREKFLSFTPPRVWQLMTTVETM